MVWPNVVGEWKGLVAMGNGCDVELALSATSEKAKQLLSQLQSSVVGHKFNSHGETLKHQSSHCHCVVGGVVLGFEQAQRVQIYTNIIFFHIVESLKTKLQASMKHNAWGALSFRPCRT